MKGKWRKILLWVIVIILLISFLMKFDFIAKPIADTFGVAVDAVKEIGNTVFYGALGLFLIWAGIGAAVPIVGIVLVGIGLVMLGISIYNKVKKASPPKD